MEAQLFDFPKLEITNKIRLIELFGGIGSQAMALRDIGADFEHYRLVEFDKYAVASYNAIHGTSFEIADIRNVHGADLGIVDRDKKKANEKLRFPRSHAGLRHSLRRDSLKTLLSVAFCPCAPPGAAGRSLPAFPRIFCQYS